MLKIFYYISRFCEIPAVEKKMLISSIVMSIYFTLIFKMVPLKYYKQIFKSNPWIKNNKNADDRIFRITKRAILRTSHIIPWKLNCVVKSLTFNYLMNKSGVNTKIEIEVYKNSIMDLKLHAFVTFNNNTVYLNRKNSLGILIPILEK